MEVVIDTSALVAVIVVNLNAVELLNLLLEILSLDLALFHGRLAMPSLLCLNRTG